MTDVSAPPLATAAKVGADRTLNVAEKPDALAPYAQHKGYFDMTFECSGNPRALVGALEVTRPLGAVVIVGLGGEATLPMNAVVTKELEVCGAFRTGVEFGWAVELISNRRVDMRPRPNWLLTSADILTRSRYWRDQHRCCIGHTSLSGNIGPQSLRPRW